MNYPNRIYTFEYSGQTGWGDECHKVVVVAASDMAVARTHVKDQIGIDVSPTWLMGAVFPKIYVSDGSVPKKVQVKILSNLTRILK